MKKYFIIFFLLIFLQCNSIEISTESGNKTITLTWAMNEGDQKFEIKWIDSNDNGNWLNAKIIPYAVSPYIHKDLTNGKKYCYRLTTNSGFMEPVCAVPSPWRTILVEDSGILNRVASDGKNKIVATTIDGAIFTSIDNGLSWIQSRDADGYTGQLNGVAYGSGNFVAVGKKGSHDDWGTVLASVDGLTWQKISLVVNDITSINYDNGRFFFFQYGMYTSEDGFSWIYDSTAASPSFNKIHWYANQYTAIGVSDSKWGIYVSSDTQAWSFYLTDFNSLNGAGIRDAFYDGNKYIAVGLNQMIQTSADLVNWELQQYKDSLPSDEIKMIAFNGSQYVTIGNFGQIFVSIDSANWSPSPTSLFLNEGSLNEELAYPYSVLNLDLYDIIWDGARFIISGYLSKYVNPKGVILIADTL